MHGKASIINHNGKGIFANIGSPIKVARYHSLIACSNSLPSELEITATCCDNQIMAIRHKVYPVVGVQFHPESVITEYAFHLLYNYFKEFDHELVANPKRCEILQKVSL